MLDASPERPPARLLICGFGPFPAARANPAAIVIESLRDRAWRPTTGEVSYAVVPTRWDQAADAVLGAAADCGCSGVLLVGVAVRASAFRVEMRAQNRTSATRPDARGLPLGRDRIRPAGPAVARVTAPVADMLAELRAGGLEAQRSSDAGAYLCNYTLYSVLTGHEGRTAPLLAGFLHVPQAAELGGRTPLEAIDRGVRAAAVAFAHALDAARAPAPA